MERTLTKSVVVVDRRERARRERRRERRRTMISRTYKLRRSCRSLGLWQFDIYWDQSSANTARNVKCPLHC